MVTVPPEVLEAQVALVVLELVSYVSVSVLATCFPVVISTTSSPILWAMAKVGEAPVVLQAWKSLDL
jgi:hypothetical protein